MGNATCKQGDQIRLMSLHEQIWQNFEHMIRDANAPELHLHKPFTTKQEFLVQCFHNYTVHNPTLKLTNLGHVILKTMYDCWSTDLPDNWTWSAQAIIHMHKKMIYPYFWDRRRFYVYHSEIGLEFELVNRDWLAWIKWE